MSRAKAAPIANEVEEPVDLAMVREKLLMACDQVGEAIANAQQASQLDQLQLLTPVMATLWSLRWELQIHADPDQEDSP